MTESFDIVPFKWWVLDDWWTEGVPPIPAPSSSIWEASYENDCERGKRTTRTVESLGFGRMFDKLHSTQILLEWQSRLGYDLIDDPIMHGGGLHVIEPGGWLNTHLDYDLHPIIPNFRRAINLVLFLNSEWHEEWGGALCLCDSMGNIARRIFPAPGRLAAFEVNDLSYHGVEQVIGPIERVTAAVYYLSAAGPHNTRRRALFIPNRDAHARRSFPVACTNGSIATSKAASM